MKNLKNKAPALKSINVAVCGALAVMSGMPLMANAQGSDETAAQMMKPTNYVEVGVNATTKGDLKFGEYNGQEKKGGSLIGNFSVKGGDAYERGEGATRWEFTGVDVGTTARELGAKVSDQGKWNLGIGYNELRHYTPTPFVTPLIGSAGSNNFTLPGNFNAINTSTNVGTVGARNLTPVQRSYLNTKDDLYSGRKNVTINAGYIFDNNWSITFDYNHLTQNGAKLITAGSMQQQVGGAAGGPVVPVTSTVGSTSQIAGETVMTLMNPTEYKTQTVKLALTYKGDKGHITGGYYGSFFRDAYTGISWVSPFLSQANPFVAPGSPNGATWAGNLNQLSTAPDNNFHQLNLSGGYALRPTTKLTAGFSYGKNTQNDNFLIDQALLLNGTPARTSLDGLVTTKHTNLKLVDTSTKDLTLSAGFKYNERHNQSPSNVYQFYDIGHNTLRTIANAPYSYKKSQLELAGDYRLDKNQKISLSYELESISRWCDRYAQTNAGAVGTATQGNNPFGSLACVVYPSSNERKFNGTYNVKLDDRLGLKAGIIAADKATNEDHAAFGPIGITSLSTGGTYYMNNGDVTGYKPWFLAQRKQRGLKVGSNWEATDQLSLTADAQYTRDNYPTSYYGVQKGDTAFANLDGTYAYSEDTSISAYASRHMRTRYMHDNASSTGAKQEWDQEMKDYETVLGINGKFNRLMTSKFSLVADLSVSMGRVTQWTNNLYQSSTCDQANALTCGYTPEVNSRVVRLKLTGDYKLDKSSTIRIAYMYQGAYSNDYLYNIYQYSLTPANLMPSNMQMPNYSLSAIGASYIYNFK